MTVKGADLTVFANWLKDQYYGPEPEMVATFNTTSYFLNEDLFNRKIETNEDGGNQFVYFLRTGWPTGFGSRGEYGTYTTPMALPDPRAGTFQKAYGSMYNHYMTYRFSGPGQARTRSDQYSFADLKKDGITTVPKAFSKYMSQMCWRAGDGVLARVNGDPGTTSNTLTVDGNMIDSQQTFGTDHFHIGMEISFASTRPTAANRGTFTGATGYRTSGEAIITGITSETVATATDTAGSYIASGVGDDDYIFWNTGGYYPQEATGLLAHLNTTGTIHNVNKATATWFQPAFMTGSAGDGTAFSLSHLDTDVTTLVHKMGPDRTKRLVIITTPLMANKIAREMKDLVRFESDDFDLKWGFSTISYVNWGTRCTVVVDNDAPHGCIWYLTPGSFAWHQTGDPHIAKDDGQTIRWISGYDAWEFMFRWISEFVCYNPGFNGVHKGFTES